ncbi:amidohydrolase [Romboutsia ilealis]|uniref:Peptidase M20 domain-containing protein 2 n=1 Tax=Romboutsia faecis TaxID=2764597 RepID=A0ABR7JPI5_9FIRM|nr:amidohydrolase [Romboutsia faecis]MBC5996835.1 amidohydrolase [Romboutsia faecis]MRN24659.1 amidohydrolase [Romboutsia ilealis]
MDNLLLDSLKKEMIDLSEEIFKNPELGFKEFETNKLICEKLEKYNINYINDIAITGIKATIDSKKEGPHIALLCELDSVPSTEHKYLGKKDNCAHSCGHYAQVGMMLGTFLALKESNIIEELGGKISFIATPAEEYCDFEYRENLVKENKISYISGKQEMIKLNTFNDIDLILSAHAMPPGTGHFAEVNSSLNGFLGKKITFRGISAHAGLNPSDGVNALNAANVALSAIAYLRETFKEDDAIRVHYVISDGGASVNSVPDKVAIDMYIRAKTLDAIMDVNKKVDRAFRGGALSIGAEVEITNTGGYLPLTQDENLTKAVKDNMLKFMNEDKILSDCHSFASGDIGDLSYLLPTVQIGVSGFAGRVHGNDFRTEDTNIAYDLPINYFTETIKDLLKDNGKRTKEILSNYKQRLTFDQYIKLLNDTNKTDLYKAEV